LFVLPHPYADIVGWLLIATSAIGLILLVLHQFAIKIGRESLIMIGAIITLCGAASFSVWYQPSLSNTALTSTPSLVSLYEQAFGNADFKIGGFTDVDLPTLKGRIYYRLLVSFNSATMFLAYYIPHSADTRKFIELPRDHAEELIRSIVSSITVHTKVTLNSTEVDLREFKFANTIHIFYEDDVLNLIDMGKVTDYYKESGMLVQLHSRDYVLQCWDQIKTGQMPKLESFEVKNGMIVKASTP